MKSAIVLLSLGLFFSQVSIVCNLGRWIVILKHKMNLQTFFRKTQD